MTSPCPPSHETSRHSGPNGEWATADAAFPRASGSSEAPDRGHRLGWAGMQSHHDFDDEAERPERPGEELGQVVAGHVLDHLAAGSGDRSVGQGHGDAEDQVTRRSVAVAQRAGVARGDHAADGGSITFADSGGIEGDHLVGAGQRLLGPGEGQAGLEHRGEIALVVLDDTVEPLGGDLDLRRLDRPAPATWSPPPRIRTRWPPAPAARMTSPASSGDDGASRRRDSAIRTSRRRRRARADASGRGRGPRRTASAWA